MTAEYKKIVSFRNQSTAIRRGELTSFCTDDVCAFTKNYGAERVLVLVNMRDSIVDFTVTPELAATPWKDVFNGGSLTLTPKISLQPYAYLVLRKESNL